jgi:hypothetical protein
MKIITALLATGVFFPKKTYCNSREYYWTKPWCDCTNCNFDCYCQCHVNSDINALIRKYNIQNQELSHYRNVVHSRDQEIKTLKKLSWTLTIALGIAFVKHRN